MRKKIMPELLAVESGSAAADLNVEGELPGELDGLDDLLIDALAKRLQLALLAERDRLGSGGNIAALAATRQRWIERAERQGLRPAFAASLFSMLAAELDHLGQAHSDVAAPEENEANRPSKANVLQEAAMRIDHVAIAVRDLEESISFYRD